MHHKVSMERMTPGPRRRSNSSIRAADHVHVDGHKQRQLLHVHELTFSRVGGSQLWLCRLGTGSFSTSSESTNTFSLTLNSEPGNHPPLLAEQMRRIITRLDWAVGDRSRVGNNRAQRLRRFWRKEARGHECAQRLSGPLDLRQRGRGQGGALEVMRW